MTLADSIIFSNGGEPVVDRRIRASLVQRLRQAKRYVLTDPAAVKVGRAIHAYPEMLVHHGQFAIPPFDECWIEFPSRNFHQEVVPDAYHMVSPEGLLTSDSRVGYLFSEGRCYVGAARDRGDPSFSPIIVELNKPSSFQSERAFAESLGISRLRLNDLFWGVSMARDLPQDLVRQFRAQHSVTLALDESVVASIQRNGRGDEFITGCAGEVRNIIGILLMLNQPKFIRYIGEVPRHRAMTHRGPKVFLGHSVIEIDLNRKPVNVILGRPKGTHATPRLHDVSGHFAHREVRQLCEHRWEQEDDRHWSCANCHGKRWWRAGHKRGDASIGIMTQERRLVYEEDSSDYE